MAKVALRACRFRGGKFTPDPDQEEFELSFKDLMDRFDLKASDQLARKKLTYLQPRAYIGLTRGSVSGKPVAFVLLNLDRGPSYEWILKKDPQFDSRLIEVYRVEAVVRDGKLQEVAA